MLEIDSILKTVQWYFGGNVLLVIAMIALLYWGNKTKKRKQYIICAVLCFALLCNDLVFLLVKKAEETQTFYRVLWILPITILAAYLMIELANQLEGIRKGVLIILIIGFVWVNINSDWSKWTTLPENVYQINNEWIELIDIIDEHSGGERVNVVDDYSVLWYGREYNDNLCTLGIGDYNLRTILEHTNVSYNPEDVRSAVCEAAADYIIIKKAKKFGNESLANADFELVGSSENYNIYYTNWRNGF